MASRLPGSTETFCWAETNPPARPGMFRAPENVRATGPPASGNPLVAGLAPARRVPSTGTLTVCEFDVTFCVADRNEMGGDRAGLLMRARLRMLVLVRMQPRLRPLTGGRVRGGPAI